MMNLKDVILVLGLLSMSLSVGTTTNLTCQDNITFSLGGIISINCSLTETNDSVQFFTVYKQTYVNKQPTLVLVAKYEVSSGIWTIGDEYQGRQFPTKDYTNASVIFEFSARGPDDGGTYTLSVVGAHTTSTELTAIYMSNTASQDTGVIIGAVLGSVVLVCFVVVVIYILVKKRGSAGNDTANELENGGNNNNYRGCDDHEPNDHKLSLIDNGKHLSGNDEDVHATANEPTV